MASQPVDPSETKNLKGVVEHVDYLDSKKLDISVDVYDNLEEEKIKKYVKPPATARELVGEILRVEDDPTINPWTFRMWFIGIGMSVFAG